MKEINIKYQCLKDEITNKTLEEFKQKAIEARKVLMSKNGAGKDFTGWVDYPLEIQEKDVESIKEITSKLHEISRCMVVVGIGGSYLGSKAAIDFLSDYYQNPDYEVIFLGNNVSSQYLKQTLEYLRNTDFCVNIISKSGKTLEPALAFRFVKELLIEKYGPSYNKYIVATTSEMSSLVHDEAVENGYYEFYIPSSIGGRYSIFTAVGLLPLCYAGYDIYEVIKGAINCSQECLDLPFDDNAAMQYAALRNIFYSNGKVVEALVSYEPKFRFLGEWWKQLYGESEGKNNKGIFPVSLVYSTDLHSLGQYVQDGIRNMFETVIDVEEDSFEITIPKDENNFDNLNYLAGKKIQFVKNQIVKGVCQAHVSGQVPNILITIKNVSEYSLGYLLYFFMFACGMSGYILGVNPFNQEGVETYKKNVLTLLKK